MNGINRRWHDDPLKQLFYFTWRYMVGIKQKEFLDSVF
ncbi:hypothetical protein HPCPY1962_1286 [Helicobacter pylori CPY1962]|nr:hypothetical protein HPCPY1962_1286 [Helicobacter pylori CPY1962]